MDIRASLQAPLVLKPLERSLVPTGLYMELPEGYEAQIRPRSGIGHQGRDLPAQYTRHDRADYRGEVKVILINLSQEEQTCSMGTA